jgi:hypothetical protein
LGAGVKLPALKIRVLQQGGESSGVGNHQRIKIWVLFLGGNQF